MCYPVCGMMHIKEPLLLIRKSSSCGGSGFPVSLSEWSFTICLMPYNHKYNVLSALLNKTLLPSFLIRLCVISVQIQESAVMVAFGPFENDNIMMSTI